VNAFPRAAGLCAVVGGALRIADSFTAGLLSPQALAALYFITDVLLLAGIAGLWAWHRVTLLAGALGLGVAMLGLLIVRASAFGLGSYQLGATVTLLGLTIYAVDALARRSTPPWAPLAWLIALALGVLGTAGFAPAAMTAAAGVAFGLGFVAAGLDMLRRAAIGADRDLDRHVA